MTAKKGDLLVENMCRFYETYWNRYNSAITYLFLDCWILALYNHVSAIKDNIDSLPDCKGKCYGIPANWGSLYEEDRYARITNSYFVHKLTYKGAHPKEKEDGRLTIYGHILNTSKT